MAGDDQYFLASKWSGLPEESLRGTNLADVVEERAQLQRLPLRARQRQAFPQRHCRPCEPRQGSGYALPRLQCADQHLDHTAMRDPYSVHHEMEHVAQQPDLVAGSGMDCRGEIPLDDSTRAHCELSDRPGDSTRQEQADSQRQDGGGSRVNVEAAAHRGKLSNVDVGPKVDVQGCDG